MTSPMVSVAMITFNHRQFIANAIESVLMQKTENAYDLVIGDDFSTDGTREILLNYQRQYPETIHLALADRNLGSKGKTNFVRTLALCSGKYVALLEGDDYWTDSQKLKVQTTFLDTHPEYSACFHNVHILNESGTFTPYFSTRLSDTYCLEDLLKRNIIPTCSVMFRRSQISSLPNWFYETQMGDWPLHIINAHFGCYGYIDMFMGIYRVHASGVWSSNKVTDKLEAQLHAMSVFRSNLDSRLAKSIDIAMNERRIHLADQYLDVGANGAARAQIKLVLASPKETRKVSKFQIARILLKANAFGLYSLAKQVKDFIAARGNIA